MEGSEINPKTVLTTGNMELMARRDLVKDRTASYIFPGKKRNQQK